MKKLLAVLIVLGALALGLAYVAKNYLTVASTVVTKEVQEGIEAQDVIDAMLSKATELNMKYVGNLPLYKELRARDLESDHLEVFQFCNPEDARKMVDLDITFSAHLPCRITLVEKDKKLYLTMMDLDLLISIANLDEELLKIAQRVRDSLHAIMDAGVTGEF